MILDLGFVSQPGVGQGTCCERTKSLGKGAAYEDTSFGKNFRPVVALLEGLPGPRSARWHPLPLEHGLDRLGGDDALPDVGHRNSYQSLQCRQWVKSPLCIAHIEIRLPSLGDNGVSRGTISALTEPHRQDEVPGALTRISGLLQYLLPVTQR